ncbi:conserved hypothetical protein, partial [Ricinus communis]
ERLAALAADVLDTADDIDVRAYQGEVQAVAGADIAVAHLAIVQRDTDLDADAFIFEAAYFIENCLCRGQRRIAGSGRIGAWKECQNRIAHEFQHLSTFVGDRRYHLVEIGVQEPEHGAAWQPIGKLGEAA